LNDQTRTAERLKIFAGREVLQLRRRH
jgi:hypothetical protein